MILAAALAGAWSSSASAEEEAPRPWTLGGEVATYSAPVLPGVVLGAELDAQHLVSGPFHAALRLGLGSTSDANDFWLVQQTHLTVLAGVGATKRLGAGLLSAELDLGSVVVREDASRHQLERLTQANIEDRTRITWSAGPIAALRLAASIELANAWFLRLSAGPQLTSLQLNGAWTWRGGVFSGIGVAHAL